MRCCSLFDNIVWLAGETAQIGLRCQCMVQFQLVIVHRNFDRQRAIFYSIDFMAISIQ